MYIKRLSYKNVGPISSIDINLLDGQADKAKPIIFVGENGSGKSTVLSNIVDAFYEIAGNAFNNARKPDDEGYQYYKAISPIEITSGKDYMFSYISFQDNKEFSYVYKCGNLSVGDLKKKLGLENEKNLNWSESVNYKNTTVNKKDAERIWNNNVVCYFGPDRYEKPVWLGDKYYLVDNYMHPSLRRNWSGKLNTPISIKNVIFENLQWLLDVIVDSRPDIAGEIGNLSMIHISPADLIELRKSRENLELIMSEILGEKVYFGLNLRNSGQSRLRIQRKEDNAIIAPSLDSLSTGQLALFSIFATIIRYADMNRLAQSIDLSQIKGIAVIDEIELHLHSKLQKEVLPKLIKLFPKIQFVITTHSPLFLLGMHDVFGDDAFDIYELPSANKISVERFSEFKHAYEYFKATETFQKDAQDMLALAKTSKKAIIVTEGSTDWKHMKTALNVLKNSGDYVDLFENMEFDFFEYEPLNSKDESQYKLEMGNTTLTSICENYAKLPQEITYIFIADRDVDATNKKLGGADKRYKKWAKNVYSFIIPIPASRAATPNICIEHLYSDDEIKTEVEIDGVTRRLYIGNEFDERGIAYQIDRFCERANICGPNKISIIEGSQGDRITKISVTDDVNNYALSKMNFAKYVTKNPEKFNFENFVEIFKIIKEIIEEEQSNV